MSFSHIGRRVSLSILGAIAMACSSMAATIAAADTAARVEEPSEPSGFFSAAPRQQPLAPAGGHSLSSAAEAIRIKPSRPILEPLLAAAYAAYQSGNLSAAQDAYGKALRNDPWNVDALHGMALLNLRMRRPGIAETYLQKALDADSSDTFALGTLLGLQSLADPAEAERRINTQLTRPAPNPALTFNLGNLLARQGRWREAQQAYFKSVERAPDNPDYLYNLAVSLEHLRQPGIAARYYQEALIAAERSPAAFEPDRAHIRIKQLQP